MDKVSIYIHTNIRSRIPAAGLFIYVIAYMTAKGEATASDKKEVKASWKGAELAALITALKRLTKPCELTLYVESPIVESAINNGWLDKWSKNGFLNSAGKPIEEAESWQQVFNLVKETGHQIKATASKNHSYMSWLYSELGEEIEKQKSQYSKYREQITDAANTLQSLDASVIEENEELKNAITALSESLFLKFGFLQGSKNTGFVRIENPESMIKLSDTGDSKLTNTEFIVH